MTKYKYFPARLIFVHFIHLASPPALQPCSPVFPLYEVEGEQTGGAGRLLVRGGGAR